MNEYNDTSIVNEARSENILELWALPELCNKNFFIPDYQRGYRWGTRQVEQLLDDLCAFFDRGKGQFYCLQPIVVKEITKDEDKNKYALISKTDNNRWYEVIDGQQRLTTIRIIFTMAHLMDRDNKEQFTLKYKTRPELGCFFEKLRRNDEDDYRIDAERQDNLDIDSWHILEAANCIMNWFKEGEARGNGLRYFKGSFYENFTHPKGLEDKKSVQIIWYELRDGSDPNETFKRLNDKKVSLNNAELIRAMFLSDSAVYEYEEGLISGYPEEVQNIVIEREQARKQAHIIEQWDIIEKQLRQPNFWAFVKKDASDKDYSSRIEYLFDLISKKKSNDKDELTTFLRFEEMVREKNDIEGLWHLWLKVESYFATLLSWYTDRNYYHKIGYLIAETDNNVLVDLLDKSAKLTKTKFNKSLDWLIRLHLTDRNTNTNVYSYNYDENRNELCRLLFFFNVESTRIATTQDKFPFGLYKATNWTLEHIHAQNSERIDRTDKQKWIEWIDENVKALRHLQKRFKNDDPFDPGKLIEMLEEKRNIVKTNTFVFNDFTKCFDSVNAYFDRMAKAEGGSPEVHNISNMTLLSGTMNTSIGNSVFEVKRQLIMKKDAEGEYIPYCTRLVFLKYYNKDKEDFSVQQSFYWSEEDRKNYLDAIEKILENVLNATNPDKEETIDNVELNEENKYE